MQDYYTPKGKHLTIADRRNIERWKQEGKSNRQIAKLLGKAPGTIDKEIIKGKVRQKKANGNYYHTYKADYGQLVYERNRKKSVRPSGPNKETAERICHYLKEKFSPEMMVKRKEVKVPVSTIYYWIHHGQLGLSPKDLLYPGRKKSSRKKVSENFKPAGKSIEERPEVINLRLENGHYEIDTVILTRAKNQCLLTLTDRRSRHEIIRLIPDKTAQSVNLALTEVLDEYKILSITADNGTEFNRLSDVFDSENLYYAHPYSSWERGTNENQNRLIRRWLPKGTIKTTPKEVAFIENWINNYPKRLFDYKTPYEMMAA